MRVLMFGWEFPPHNSGGLGVACLGITNGLIAENIDVTFVLPKQADYSVQNIKFRFADIPEIQEKVKFRTIDSPLHPYLTSHSYLEQFGTEISAKHNYGNSLVEEVLRYGAMATEIAKEEEFDVIHAHDWLSFGAGISAKKVSGKPLIVHIHATEIDRSGGADGKNEAIFELEKQGFEVADCIVAVSEYTRQSVIDFYGIDPNKIVVVHNGIDAASMEIAEEEHVSIKALKAAGNKVVLFLGRLTIQKSPESFVKAAKLVLEHDPNVVFLMAGSGDMEEELIRMVADMGISDKVMFIGFIRGMEKAQTYKSADLFVMPSASEPFGIVPLESLINGTPVIISKQSGVSEVLKHALKVDFWDVEELANQIYAVLHHQPLHQNLSENGKLEASSVTWNKAAYKLKSVYQSMTGLLK